MIYSEILNKILNRESFTLTEAELVMETIIGGDYTPAQIAALLVALRIKGETAEEIVGFVRSLRTHAIALPGAHTEVFDTCGTGGDGRGTFNISTATALVVVACGVKVAKHGNRAVSSACGSADVLEALGVNINLTPAQASRCLEEAGIVFLFAPLYHPAFAKVGPVRKELGVRTLFNILGPLVNPAMPRRQIIGIADPAKMQIIAQTLRLLGSEHAMVVRSGDGHDELTTTATADAYEVKRGIIEKYVLDPQDYGFSHATNNDLRGGDVQENASIIRAVLSGEKGARLDTVLFNSGAALYVAGQAKDVGEGIAIAREAVTNGEATKLLEKFIEVSNRLKS
ncbi:MAG: anthranilate phosphoribosyltransferase [Patescibacteria group bacterium]